MNPEKTVVSVLQSHSTLQQVGAWGKANGVPVYLVGGALRDALTHGAVGHDLDLVVPAKDAKRTTEALADLFEAKWICLDPHNQIYRVLLLHETVTLDIAAQVGPDFETDLARRDLTVNAIGYDFQTEAIIDPFEGQADLEKGLIRMLSADNMRDDPLRLLRVFRFAAELGFSDFDPQTLHLVETEGDLVLRAAPERIHYEWMKLISAPTCFAVVRRMADCGMLEALFPELSSCRPIPGNQYHHLGLFDHTLELLNQLEIHLPSCPDTIQNALSSPANPVWKRIAVVRLACLFHDIGKPATMQTAPDGQKMMFHGHDMVSAELTEGIGLRMKWGNTLTQQVMDLVRWHLYPGDLLKPEVTDKAKRKCFRKIGALMPELMMLAIADRYSTQGPLVTQMDLATQKQGLLTLWQDYETYQTIAKARPKLLGGKEIMDLLQLEAGPKVGQILAALQDAQEGGFIQTHQDAINWVKEGRY